MYSLVLMAAIGGSPASPGADQAAAPAAAPAAVVVGCTDCTGCTGYAASCTGCCGGGHRLFHRSSCHGCCGGVVYSSCSGCCGGGFLGHRHSCHGCCGGSSCFGSCSGFIHQSAWGNCSGCCGGFGPTTHFYPAYSTPVLTGAAPFYYVGPSTHAVPPVVVPPAKVEEEKKDDKKKGASLKFDLPAGAALFVDGVKTPGDGAERSFFTPPLEAGQKYFYDVRAEIVVDGKTITEDKRVIVEAGVEVRESFAKVIAAAQAGTTVAGK